MRVEVALAAPIWRPLSYLAPPEMAPLVRPLARVVAPLRGRPTLGFALGPAQPGDVTGLKPIADVLDDPGQPTLLPGNMLRFYERAAAYYQAPLGRVLAWALPAGLGSLGRAGAEAVAGADRVEILSFRQGPEADHPKPGTRASQMLSRIKAEGPLPLDLLRVQFPRARDLARRLETAGWLTISHRSLVRDLAGRPIMPEPRPEVLTPDQDAALDALAPAVAAGGFKPFLLYGVTGSGKTEMYLQACEQALAAGRSALILTPEIALCLRLEGALRQRLGQEQVAVLHSGLSPAMRRGQWRAIASGQRRVVVGARSAVFAPLADCGLICVDEEQDEAYKQSDRLRYHARDLALLRGQEQDCPVILGTATPAVTTWHRAQQGEMQIIRMPHRVGTAQLPSVEVVDLKSEGRLSAGFLSRRLRDALEETVAAGQQAILFLNRRGFAPALICQECGKTVGCPSCSVSLTMHRAKRMLMCHVCGHTRALPQTCPHCGAEAEKLKPLGLGTEQVADTIAEHKPDWRIARLDSDTADNPAKLKKMLRQVAAREVDLVVGTQMITKGHHFPGISLVGVLLMDQALALPDFRAAERAFSVLTQVAGRAGRGQDPGRVIVQTYDPDHLAVRAALQNNPELFYASELEDRKALGYPPFRRLVGLRLEGPDEGRTGQKAAELAAMLAEARRRLAPQVLVLGPTPAPLAKAQGRYRFLLLIKAPAQSQAAQVLRLALHRLGALPAGMHLAVDVDPISLI